MYARVKSPKKRITKEWSDQAFAPLNDYLEREFPAEKDQIMSFLMFMGNEDEKFHYKNNVTKGYVVFDQSGEVISRCDSAFEYQFEDMFGPRGEYKSMQDYRLHPNVTGWIERALSKSAAAKYGLEVGVFLQELWGPMVNYDFSDLKVGYPLRRLRLPYCLYIYPSEFRSLMAFQFVGDEIVEQNCSIKQQRDFTSGERELTIAGWQRVDIICEHLEYIMGLKRDLPLLIKHANLRDPLYELSSL